MIPARTVRIGGVVLEQSTGQTCGAMCLLMAKLEHDAAFKDSLLDCGAGNYADAGSADSSCVNPDRAKASRVDSDSSSFLAHRAHIAHRLREAELELFDQLRAGGLGAVSWPSAIGTPPWGMAREMGKLIGVPYRSFALLGASVRARSLLLRAYIATCAGFPVALYSGGSAAYRWLPAIPRHVVLALPAESRPSNPLEIGSVPACRIYDPASGEIHEVRLVDLVGGGEPLRALGNWTQVVCAVLPDRPS